MVTANAGPALMLVEELQMLKLDRVTGTVKGKQCEAGLEIE